MPFENGRVYGANIDGQQASIGANTQINPAYFWKKALIEIVKERVFGQMADVRAMPKHMGKTIKQHHYLPLLDDANINDQGIDANGVVITHQFKLVLRNTAAPANVASLVGNDIVVFYGRSNSAAAAQTDAETQALAYINALNAANANVYNAGDFADYATAIADVQVVADMAEDATHTDAAATVAYGNLYGSSKDPGYISAKLPALSETGGRVNRVGFTRKTIEATIEKFGFFDEYTQESMDFDTDAELMMHISRETLRGANEITEDALQIDLLNAAGVVRFAGDATVDAELTGDSTAYANPLDADVVSYDDFLRLSIDLNNNRCPKNTTIISGSRMIDTKTIGAARYAYCGSELLPHFHAMKDPHNNKAFIEVQHYASAGNVAAGEVGSIGYFRIIVVLEMMKWEGAGAVATNNANNFYETNGNFDVFPILVVGSGSFTTIGFQTNGKMVKFKITHKKPGRETADRNDPYGETGFYSIKWYYGFMALRPEWIALMKTCAY